MNAPTASPKPAMPPTTNGQPPMLELLLASGADPHIQNYDDTKAVDLAATRGCLELMRQTAGLLK